LRRRDPQEFRQIIGELRESAELTARYGGEEFAIISPGASKVEAMRLANRIQDRLSAKQWLLKDGRRIRNITASIGIAQLMDGDTAESILERADENLYKSKIAGKNRTTADNQHLTSS
jgi:diguanylate cyclase (GGDEF)-like protein